MTNNLTATPTTLTVTEPDSDPMPTADELIEDAQYEMRDSPASALWDTASNDCDWINRAAALRVLHEKHADFVEASSARTAYDTLTTLFEEDARLADYGWELQSVAGQAADELEASERRTTRRIYGWW